MQYIANRCFSVSIARFLKTPFFSVWVFFHDHSRITGLQGKEEGISLTLHYHFHPLHRYLHISRAITAESSPLHIGSSQTQTGNLWFPSASRSPLNYSPFFYKHLLWLRLTFHTYQVQVELLFFHYLPRATSWRATRMTIILFQKSLILFKFWV